MIIFILLISTPSAKCQGENQMCWCHFDKEENDSAKCKICGKFLKCFGNTTSSLSYHLKNIHKITQIITTESSENEQCNKKRRIDEDVAKLACQDGISFVRIARSFFIQESFKKFDYDSAPPSSSLSVKNMVIKYAEEKKESLHTYFENEAKLGKRFALTLDEYTSLQNEGYLS